MSEKVDQFSVPVSSWVDVIRDDESLFDVTIHVGKQRVFRAHRLVLATAVPFFQKSFKSGMKEAESGEFHLKEIDPDIFHNILELIYGRPIVLEMETILDMHAACNFLGYQPGASKCVDFMSSNLGLDNVLVIWLYTDRQFEGFQALRSACCVFIRANFSSLAQTDHFLALKFDQMSKILLMDGLKVDSEDLILEAALDWLDHDWLGRLAYTEQLLGTIDWSCIDFGLCHKLKSVCALRKKACETDPEKMARYKIGERFLGPPEKSDSTPGDRSQPFNREYTGSGAGLTDSSGTEIYCISHNSSGAYLASSFNVDTSTWKETKGINIPLGGVNARILNLFDFGTGKPYILRRSGPDGAQALMVHQMDYNRSMIRWNLVVPDDFDISDITAAGGGKGIVCLISLDDTQELKKMLVYQIDLQAVDSVSGDDRSAISCVHSVYIQDLGSALNSRLKKSSLCVWHNHIFILGGLLISNKYSGVAKIYSLSKNAWKDGPNMIHSVKNPSITVTKRAVFVVGGICQEDPISSVLYLEKDLAKWKYLPPMNISRKNNVSAVCRGKLYVFGGKSATNRERSYAEHLDLQNIDFGFHGIDTMHNRHPDFAVSL